MPGQTTSREYFLKPIEDNAREYLNWDKNRTIPGDRHTTRGYPFLSKSPDTTSKPETLRPGLIVALHPWLEQKEWERGDQWDPDFTFAVRDGKRGETDFMNADRHGLWRKEFMTQPPVTKALFTIFYGDVEDEAQDLKFEKASGITMGDLQDLMFETIIEMREERMKEQRAAAQRQVGDGEEHDLQKEVLKAAKDQNSEEAIRAEQPYVSIYGTVHGHVWDGSPWVTLARKDAGNQIREEAKAEEAKEGTGRYGGVQDSSMYRCIMF